MAIIKCKMCGGDLNLIEGVSTAECEYCGSVQTVPTVDDEKKLTLFARANRLRVACEFDKAAGIYEAIVADFPEEAEAYWGLVLCKYGIEYVDDPATGKKIPTCHRSSFNSIMEDSDFEQALENADIAAQKVYRQEAKEFERIRKGILKVSSSEKPYDIFICYKETDEKGDRTLDSVLAQDLYTALTDKGYRVFFSRITLQGKLGEAYEPYIFAALNSSKVMLAVGTCYEYYNAVWVKNEWSRYLKLCAADKSKHLIPCYKDLAPEDMPKEFHHLQGADLGKMGAVQDILFNMEKYIPLKKEPTTVIRQPAVAASTPTVESYLKRVFMFLEDGDWESADEYCEKVLDIDPENARAYLGKLLAELHLCKDELLPKQSNSFENLNNYQKAIRFADEELRSKLQSYAAVIKRNVTRQEEEKRIALEHLKKQILANHSATQKLIAAGSRNTFALMTDGTVVGATSNNQENSNISQWRRITAISAGSGHTVGLKFDGTVMASGSNDNQRCDVRNWRNIVAISAGAFHTVGLKSDGTVVATGPNHDGRCSVSSWHKIVKISAGTFHTVGLNSIGTVVATGNNEYDNCAVDNWENIIDISAGGSHTIGLKHDGTVVAVGSNKAGQCNVDQWQNIVTVVAGINHTIGLTSDGTVTATGDNKYGQCEVSGWRNIVAISVGNRYTVGLKSDGTVLVTGHSYDDRKIISSWKLFENLENLEQEQSIAIKKREEEDRILQQQQGWCHSGLCRHCGGELKGFFTKKCVSCGKPKDY